jgi:hypothetical protein
MLFSKIADEQRTPLTSTEKEVLDYLSHIGRSNSCAAQIGLTNYHPGKHNPRKLENTERTRIGLSAILGDLTRANDISIKLTGKGGYETPIANIQKMYGHILPDCAAKAG